MRYRELIDRARREGILFSALLELTYRCTLDCAFCYNDRSRTDRPLTTGQWRTLIRDLANLGTLHLTLSGGEPLEHEDFFELGALARSLDMVVRVKSNGLRLDAAAAARMRDEVDPFAVDVTIHGASAATHDRQTRRVGSFERVRGNLDAMLAAGLRVRLTTVLTAWNEHELDDMLALAGSIGLVLNVAPEISPRDDGDQAPLSLLPSVDGLTRLARHAGALRADAADCPEPPAAGPMCGAGSSGIAVDPFGNVLPCVEWREAVGNLHDEPIAAIWSPARWARIRATMTAARDWVDAQPERPAWFCPATAARVTGQPLSLHDSAERRLEAERRARRRE